MQLDKIQKQVNKIADILYAKIVGTNEEMDNKKYFLYSLFLIIGVFLLLLIIPFQSLSIEDKETGEKLNIKLGCRRIAAFLLTFPALICGLACATEAALEYGNFSIEAILSFIFGMFVFWFILFYLYLGLEKIIYWIIRGFKTNKEIKNIQEEEIKEEMVTAVKMDKEETTNEKQVPQLQKIQIQYNRNPFSTHGRLNRLHYFIYSCFFNIGIAVIALSMESLQEAVYIIALLVILFVLSLGTMFIIKKRVYDITLSNKKAWIISAAAILLSLIAGDFASIILLPLGVWLVFKSSKVS